MDSPSPVLPAAREREVSPRANRSNTLGQQGRRDARAVVAYPQHRLPSDLVDSSATTVVPGGVCVRALAEQVGQHLVQPVRRRR